MSAKSEALHAARPRGIQVVLAAAVLLIIGIAVLSWFPRAITETGSGSVLDMPDAYATNQSTQEYAASDYGIRPHGPNQMPRQMAVRELRIRPHGPGQMPKR